jgi:tetratricopeptide (TPR) repeat protein
LQVIATNKATSDDYSSIGINYIYTRQLDKALKYLNEGQKIDNTDLLLKVNLAHAYLLNEDYKAAKDIYKKYQNQNVTASLSWKDKIKFDFQEFTKAGIISPDYNRILRLLTN